MVSFLYEGSGSHVAHLTLGLWRDERRKSCQRCIFGKRKYWSLTFSWFSGTACVSCTGSFQTGAEETTEGRGLSPSLGRALSYSMLLLTMCTSSLPLTRSQDTSGTENPPQAHRLSLKLPNPLCSRCKRPSWCRGEVLQESYLQTQAKLQIPVQTHPRGFITCWRATFSTPTSESLPSCISTGRSSVNVRASPRSLQRWAAPLLGEPVLQLACWSPSRTPLPQIIV